MTKTQKIAAIPVLSVLLLAGGAIAGYASFASAQTNDSVIAPTVSVGATSTDRHMPGGNFHPRKGGHVGKNSSKEALLTGDAAAKVTAAAQAAVQGATIERVETDAEGAAYEAHMSKSDGSHVTVKFDTNFNVTATEDGPQGPIR